jgi:EmrB/QacA subfamily drug resistance transporter
VQGDGGQGDGGGDESGNVAIEAPGADEVVVVPWPMLFRLRRRVSERIESSDRYRWWILWTVLAGLFAVGFTVTILAVSLPRIATDLHSDTSTVTWVVTGPLLAFGVAGPILGKAGDVYGHRRVYLLGLVGSIVFALASASAWSAGSLITFRVLGVAEGAATGPASMAIIMKVFPDRERVKAMGFWSLVGAGAPVIGVVAGGPLVEHVGWRWIFILQAPFTIAALVLAAIVLPTGERGTRQPIDYLGVATLSGGVTALLIALNRGPAIGWDHPAVVVGFALAPVLLVAFVVVERRTSHPLIPLDYFRRRKFSFPIAVQFFANFAYMGSFILTPLYLDEAFGYGETKIGLLSIARPVTFSITAPVAGFLTVKLGERLAAMLGCTAVIASMLVWWTVHPGAANIHVMGALALAGVGLGVSAPAMAAAIANSVDEASLGIAGAAQQLMTQVGIVAGIQLAETFQQTREAAAGLATSYREAYLLLGAVCVFGVIAGAFVRSTSGRDESGRAAALDIAVH